MSPFVTLVGRWTLPPDTPSLVALCLALASLLVAFSPAMRREIPEMRPSSFLKVAAFVAAFLSLGYLAIYLRGGARIIDSTMYVLQGRALAHGAFAWPVDEPTESVRGRFLLEHAGRVGGIFPPGFPLLEAIGWRLRAPMVVGPLLAMLLVVATYHAARELARDVQMDAMRDNIARMAVLLSLFCAVLRYHTADAMSHGAAALFLTTAFTARLRAVRTGSRRFDLLAGLAWGCLLATRPISAIGVGLVMLLLQRHRARTTAHAKGSFVQKHRAFLWTGIAILPGLLFLLASQRAVTGSFFGSTQRAYYATSDGPPGCFRYGFGAAIGCLYEHRDFVRDRLPHGYTILAALLTTLRRLHHHLADVANFEPLALLVLVPLFRKDARTTPVRAALLVILFHVLAYAPFYFDGDYPGGGARFFADLLPLEHALLALGIAWLTANARTLIPEAYQARAAAILALSLVGFGVHTVHSHLALQARDGGRPMFEPDQVAKLSSDHGLLYMTTDHGFDLAYDPLPVKAEDKAPDDKQYRAVRYRGDDTDRLVYELAGKPPSYRYVFDPLGAPAEPKVESWAPPHAAARDPWRFEAESSWPPLAQDNAWAEPVWMDGASNGRALVITAGASPNGNMDATGSVLLTLPVPNPDEALWVVTPRVMFRGIPGHGEIRIENGDLPNKPAVWTWDDGPNVTVGAHEFSNITVPTLHRKTLEVRVTAQGQVAWDRTFLRNH